MLAHEIKNLQVQSPEAKVPLASMAISAFEIRTPLFPVRRDIPAATSLVRHERQAQTEVPRNILNKTRVILDRLEPVSNGQRGSSQV